MKSIAIVRERGQLTIPDAIRKMANWLRTSSAVTISMEKPDEIKIIPHKASHEIDWDTLWRDIKRVRAFKGEDGNLSQFIMSDRETH